MMMECGNLAALCNTGQVHLTCFSLCTFRSRGVCVRCAVQTKKASAHGVEFLSSFGASLVSIAGGADRDSI